MTRTELLRRARGLIGNAVVWGALWSTLVMGLEVFGKVVVQGGDDPRWWPSIAFAIRAGVMGALASTAFSSLIGWWYRGRRLSTISWWRFGLGGGAAIAIFIPTFLTIARALSGDPVLPLRGYVSNTVFGFLFGTIAATGTLLLAQYADRRNGSSSGLLDDAHETTPADAPADALTDAPDTAPDRALAAPAVTTPGPTVGADTLRAAVRRSRF